MPGDIILNEYKKPHYILKFQRKTFYNTIFINYKEKNSAKKQKTKEQLEIAFFSENNESN